MNPAFKRERHGGKINLRMLLENGITIVSINKSVDKSSARVGDTLTYTVQVSNGAGAEVNIRDTVMRDAIPDGLTFRGNVTVDGYSTVYQYDNENRTLSVPLDAIAPGQTKTISFDVLVNSDAYGMMIENTAVASGSNAPDTEDTDDGVTIENGTPDGRAGAKSANKMTARVGDTITYTITLENSAMATADWTGVTVTDALPDGVTFTGNVQKDGQATTEYSYDSSSRTSIRPVFSIAPVRENVLVPGLPAVPIERYQSAPCRMIFGTLANVSTLLRTVGFSHSPFSTVLGGLTRGIPRFPSMDAVSALPSPHTNAPAPRLICIWKQKSVPKMLSPNKFRFSISAIAWRSLETDIGYSART